MLEKQAPLAVIGAGIIGLMQAKALLERGHKVLLIDAQPSAAAAGSYSNAGLLALGHTRSWAAPSAYKEIITALANKNAGLKISTLPDASLMRWGLEFFKQTRFYAANTGALTKLARFSVATLRAQLESEPQAIKEQFNFNPVLYFFHSTQEAAQSAGQGEQALAMQIAQNDRFFAQHISKDPQAFGAGFASSASFSGDCFAYAQSLMQQLESHKNFASQLRCSVQGFALNGRKITGLDLLDQQGERQKRACNGVVIAAGNGASNLAAQLGFRPMIYPVKGYASSWAIKDASLLPRHAYIDERNFVAVSVFKQRLRITTIAEFAGHDTSLPAARKAVLADYARRFFAQAVDLQQPEYWVGFRPSTPSSLPYLGRIAAYDNAWLNAGHGQLGWTLAAGSAQLMAQQISAEPLDLEGVSVKAAGFKGL